MYSKKIVTISIVALCVVIGASAWWGGFAYSQHLSADRGAAIASLEDTDVSYLALYSLRSHGTNYMLSGMELTLDHSIVGLWEHRDVLPRQQLASALQLLREVKAYRQKYPRHIEGAQYQAIQTKADTILAGSLGG
jgi:hypothetical protein